MVNKDNRWVISLEDMERYIHIKTEEDYTYEEAMSMLADGTYKNVPYSFITFIARMIEISIIEVYPEVIITGDEEGKLYARATTGKNRFPMYVRYKYGKGGIKVLKYATEYVYTRLDRQSIDKFIHEYQKRVIHKLVDEQDKWVDEELEGDLFDTIRWVAMYYEHMSGEAWEDTMQGRVKIFLNQLREYADLKGLNYPESVAFKVIQDFWVEKIESTKWTS